MKGRNRISAFQALARWIFSQPGATRFAALSACPWLSYSAPLALGHTAVCRCDTLPLALRLLALFLHDVQNTLTCDSGAVE